MTWGVAYGREQEQMFHVKKIKFLLYCYKVVKIIIFHKKKLQTVCCSCKFLEYKITKLKF